MLGSVGSQVTDVASGLPGWGLVDDHVVAVDAMGREVVVAVRRGRGHAHLLHGLLLGHGRLALLVGPVAADSTGAEPLAIHGAEGLLGIRALAEGDEAIATRAAGFHVPHDTGLGNGTKGREGLEENFIIDFIRQIADEDMKMVRSVLLVGAVGLIGPVDANLLYGAY